MTIWGVDLGVRSAYAAGLGDGGVLVLDCLLQRPNKISRSRELRLLHEWAHRTFAPDDAVYIEEPPLAGSRNLRVFLHLGQVAGVIASACEAVLVPVSSWKKGTVGNGAASKELVASWLSRRHPDLYRQCGGDQNRIDATCIALYGSLDQG